MIFRPILSLWLLFCLSIVTCFAQQPAAEAKPVPDYIRYRSAPAGGEKPDILETAVSRFQKGNHFVDLVAVVHLGDVTYFKKLDKSLTAYDTVLYEMVGGPYTEEKARQSRDAKSTDSDLAQVQGLQQMAKGMLGLEFQLDHLNYLAPNFLHADMTAEQFQEQSAGGEDLSNMLTRAMQIAQSGKVPGMPTTEAEANQMMFGLLGAVMSGNSNQLKRTLAPILAQAEAFISEVEGDEGSVLISKRNEIVIKKINDVVTRRGGIEDKKVDAVLYGAGHMPDLEKRLIDLGYKKVSTDWRPSWVIGKGASKNEDPPSLDSMMKQVGGLMEMLKEAQKEAAPEEGE